RSFALDSAVSVRILPPSSAASGRGSEQNSARRRTSMATGKVKWFNDAKGFGFITRDSGPDLFVHHTAIVSEGFRSLSEGQEVEFDVTEGPKGLQATNVRPAG